MWEEAYLKRLHSQRLGELVHQRRYRVFLVITIALGRASPMIGATVTFIVYSAFYPLTPEIIFPALSIFQDRRLE